MGNVILLDICNTLADVNGAIESLTGCKRPKGLYFHPSVNPQWFEDHLEVFEIAKELPYAAEAVRILAKAYDIVYVTARPKCAEDVTRAWLNKHHFPQAEMVFTTDKVASARNRNVIYAIDDAPHEIMAYVKAGIPVKVFSTDYNADMHITHFAWESVLRMECVL